MVWHFLMAESDAPKPGHGVEWAVSDQIVALYCLDNGTPQGELYALDGLCPHQGGPLGRGDLAGCLVTCPWHGWKFDVRTGRHELSPHLQHTSLPIKREQGKIWVDLAHFSLAHPNHG